MRTHVFFNYMYQPIEYRRRLFFIKKILTTK